MSAILPRVRRNRRCRRTEEQPVLPNTSPIPSWDPLAVTIHEIRAPLAVISAAAEILQASVEHRGADYDAVLLQRIRRSASWLATLVDNLSSEIELSTNGLSLDQSTIDLRECVQTSLAITHPLFDQRHQSVHWSDEDAVTAYGDRRRIEQELINLLINASKYGDLHSEIRIAFETRGESVGVQIHNDGPSIPPWEQEKIFERYVRGSSAHSASHAGLGLGLHIVKTIVEAHGGQVGVVSSVLQGTHFWFTLPSC